MTAAFAQPAAVATAPAFKGTLSLDVDATDTRRRIVTVHERIPVQRPGEMTLAYPQWDAASHAPSLSAHRLAGLQITAAGRPLPWVRDPARVHLLRVQVPAGVSTLAVDFQYLSPLTRDVSATLMDGFVGLSWSHVLLYPAGWPAQRLPVQATVRLPAGMAHATALAGRRDGDALRFEPVTLDRLLDSPVFASRHGVARQISGGDAPVWAHWLATDAAAVAQAPTFDAPLAAVVRETQAVFGPPPFARYDFLLALDDRLPGPGGIEHAASSEVFLPADLLANPAAASPSIDVVPHELIHAWNGRWRLPADMAAATPNDPVTGTLLWVYEGQTEFWSRVIAARAGLRSVQQTQEALALDAAVVQSRAGRRWKSLADSANDPLTQSGPASWRDWQRREDYYVEGVLFWLDVDAQLRRCSRGARGLDDFARQFFSTAGRQPQERQRTYAERDVAQALGRVCPGPWAQALRRKLDAHDDGGLLDGLSSHGWRLVFRDTPTAYFRLHEASEGVSDLTWSVGMTVTPAGQVKAVAWDGAAFRAGIVPGTRLKAVNGEAFDVEALKRAIAAAPTQGVPLRVLVDGHEETVSLDAHAGLRYPHLERVDGTEDSLSALLAARAR
jgi:predicted metalloprotease with PDZ domain